MWNARTGERVCEDASRNTMRLSCHRPTTASSSSASVSSNGTCVDIGLFRYGQTNEAIVALTPTHIHYFDIETDLSEIII
jgi:hypothetical protein